MQGRFEEVLFVDVEVLVDTLLHAKLTMECGLPKRHAHLLNVIEDGGNGIPAIWMVINGRLLIA